MIRLRRRHLGVLRRLEWARETDAGAGDQHPRHRRICRPHGSRKWGKRSRRWTVGPSSGSPLADVQDVPPRAHAGVPPVPTASSDGPGRRRPPKAHRPTRGSPSATCAEPTPSGPTTSASLRRRPFTGSTLRRRSGGLHGGASAPHRRRVGGAACPGGCRRHSGGACESYAAAASGETGGSQRANAAGDLPDANPVTGEGFPHLPRRPAPGATPDEMARHDREHRRIAHYRRMLCSEARRPAVVAVQTTYVGQHGSYRRLRLQKPRQRGGLAFNQAVELTEAAVLDDAGRGGPRQSEAGFTPGYTEEAHIIPADVKEELRKLPPGHSGASFLDDTAPQWPVRPRRIRGPSSLARPASPSGSIWPCALARPRLSGTSTGPPMHSRQSRESYLRPLRRRPRAWPTSWSCWACRPSRRRHSRRRRPR